MHSDSYTAPTTDTMIEAKQDSGFATVTIKKRCCLAIDLETENGRRQQMVKILVISLLPGVLLVVQNCINLYSSATELNQKQITKEHVLFSMEIGEALHRTQIERGTTALYISSNGDEAVYKTLVEIYQATDIALNAVGGWLSIDQPSHFKSRQIFHNRIKQYRASLNINTTTIEDAIRFYTEDNTVIINWLIATVKSDASIRTWAELVAYHMVINSKEHLGIERALGSTFFARGGLNLSDMLWYQEHRILGIKYLEKSQKYSSRTTVVLNERYTSDLSMGIERFREEIALNDSNSKSVLHGIDWFTNMTVYIDILKEIQDTMGQDIVKKTDEEIADLQSDVTSNACLMTFVLLFNLLFLPIMLVVVFKMTATIHRVASQLKQKTSELVKEKKRSETLLYLMMPESVAQQLVAGKSVKPESFDSVTVFFSDVVGFTAICSRCTPMQVIAMLNNIYATCDDLLEKYDVYKVETIGDAYMVTSGLPKRNGTRHVAEIAVMALDLLQTIANLVVPQVYPESLKLRIGINTGPVVAGVVGHKMLRYCVFGDTVNTASRMESTGLPLKVHSSESSYLALKQFPEFNLCERGDIAVKGKGQMKTYWLEGMDRMSDNRHVAHLQRDYSNQMISNGVSPLGLAQDIL